MKKRKKLWLGKFFLLTLILLTACLLGITYLYRPLYFFVLLPFCVTLILYVILRYRYLHYEIFRVLQGMADRLLTQKGQGIVEIPVPSIIVSNSEILWHNQEFVTGVSGENMFGKDMQQVCPYTIDEICQQQGRIITYQQRHFKTYAIASQNTSVSEHLLTFIPVTELYNMTLEYQRSRPAVVIFLLDSYEEIVRDCKESEKTYILSEINRQLEQYISETSGFLSRLDRNRYLAVIEKRHFDAIVDHRFSILADMKTIQTSKRVPITLSIGASNQPQSLEQNERDALLALEMALGRGGDQAVVKNKDGFQFFGGTSAGVESRTKVKTRIVASAMEELIQNCDNVLVMGHKYPDLDAMGSAIGIARACQCFGKDVRILLDETKCLARPLVDYIRQQTDQELFLSHANIKPFVRRGTLLFITDSHSKLFLESEEAYRSCQQIVVIDHHRKTVDYIDNALIFYHEPYASSASELVAELVQYFSNDCHLESCHADALLAGIMLDTKNFIMNAGVRTFEAAAFLRRCGADTLKVRKLFSGTMDDYRNRSALVSTAEMYLGCAIATTEQQIADPRVLASQAADDLLGIHGIEASFVIYKVKDKVNISARSLGNINVQLMMEELGGGGHLTMAAVQLDDTDCEGVKNKLIPLLEKYLK